MYLKYGIIFVSFLSTTNTYAFCRLSCDTALAGPLVGRAGRGSFQPDFLLGPIALEASPG